MSLDKKPCDMGEICLNCQPRGINGECPDAKPVPAGPVIKVLVRGSNAPLHVTGWYGDTVFVDLPEAAPAAPEQKDNSHYCCQHCTALACAPAGTCNCTRP
jgi:hypothetical protein